MSRLSIRWRITLWNTAAFAVVLAGFGLLVYSLLRQTHYDQVDRSMKSVVDGLAADVRRAADPERAVQAWIRKHPKAPAIIYDSHGELIARSERLDAADLPAPTYAADQAPSSESLGLLNLGHVRRMTASVALDDQSYTVVLFRDLEHIDEEMSEVVTALMITTPVALALAAALAYGVSRRSLAPVEQLRQRTDEITADRLDRRLPIANPTDELGLLAQTVNSMIERLERSFAEIRRFTADASHELRTPLAVIRSESELGLDPAATFEDARARFGSILEECARLTRMTDQLLTLSREDAGIAAPKRDRIPLLSLVREAVETMTPLAAEKRQTLAVIDGDEVVVSGDAERLRQVLYNLLANAIKYTAEEGKIETSLERRGAEAVLSVRDNGIGISAEHLPHVFDRFYRVDKSRSQREGGAGLGLSIVKSIIAAHGGRVEAESSPGAGSTFRVYLPLASAAEAELAERHAVNSRQ
jgi:heavy metal sensor kinase